MRFLPSVMFIALICTVAASFAADPPLRANLLLDGGQVVLPNAWKISPAGHATQLPGDMPERILVTSTGQILVNTGGYNEHGVSLLSPAGELLSHVKVPRTFVGMCIDPATNHLYLSGGQTL